MLSGEHVQDRENNPWVQGMVEALYKALRDALDIYQNHREDYYRMIINGFARAKGFDWRKSAEEYFKVYGKIGDI
jgi:glycosyltransferase involved in cell wall biosynthesis